MASTTPRFSIVASALTRDLRSVPRVARVMGFIGVQLDLGWSDVDLLNLSGSGRRELRHVFSTQSQEIVGLRADLGPRGFLPGADVDRLLNEASKLMDAASGLLAPLVCLDIGPLPEPPRIAQPRPSITSKQAGLILLPTEFAQPSPAPEAPPAPSPADVAATEQLSAALDELGRLADRYSVVVAFRSDLSSLAALSSALSLTSCPWFGVDLDPVAIQRDPWDVETTLSQVGPRLRHVRARDAVKGSDRRTRPATCGAGSTDWPQLLADLDAADYQGWMTIDPSDLTDRLAAAEGGLKFLCGVVK